MMNIKLLKKRTKKNYTVLDEFLKTILPTLYSRY